MSKALLNECATLREDNITKLQLVTDYMLAFFGSIDERVFERAIRKLIKTGKLIENIDLHIRFEYPHFRIEQAYIKLKSTLEKISPEVDEEAIAQLDTLLEEENYNIYDAGYKSQVITLLSGLVKI